MSIEVSKDGAKSWADKQAAEEHAWHAKNGEVDITQGIPTKPNAIIRKRRKRFI